MDDQKPSTGEIKTPPNMVVYRPDEPLYETLYTCVCLSEIRDMADEEVGEPKKEKQSPGG
jgi:hypothetical protein